MKKFFYSQGDFQPVYFYASVLFFFIIIFVILKIFVVLVELLRGNVVDLSDGLLVGLGSGFMGLLVNYNWDRRKKKPPVE